MPSLRHRLSRLNHREGDAFALIRLMRAGGLLVVIFLGGTIGFHRLGAGEYTWLECAYMTAITLTSIGYGEVIPITGHELRMAYTIGLSLIGMGVMLYFVSTLTAFIVDGELRELLVKNRMKNKIESLENHYIIAGVGDTGRYVLEEMLRSQRLCVVIEHDRQVAEDFMNHSEARIPVVVGDATNDDVLKEAGIERALGVVFALGNDRDNLFATITARRLDPDLRIVTRGEDPMSEQKFLMAGATSVIFTNVLGGMRMAAELVRPEVTTFLDLMMHDHGHYRRVEELPIPDHSPLIGKPLRNTEIRKHTDALIIAIHDAQTHDYHFNPTPDTVIRANTKLILLTLIEDVDTLEALIAGRPLPRKKKPR